MVSPLLIFLALIIVLPFLDSWWQHLPHLLLTAVLLISIATLAPNRTPSLHWSTIPVPGELEDLVAWTPGAAGDAEDTDLGEGIEDDVGEKKFVEVLDI